MFQAVLKALDLDVPPTVLASADEVIEMRRREFIALLGGAALVWPLAATAQLTTPPTQATTVNPPQIQVVRVKPIDPAVPKLRFQLSDGSVDLMKAFSLGGSEGVGGVWEIPLHIALPDTFDARYGQW